MIPWHIYDSHSMVRVYITCEACIFIGEAITPTNTREVLPSGWTLVLTVQGTSKLTVSHYFQSNLKFNWQNFLRGSWSVGFLYVCLCMYYVCVHACVCPGSCSSPCGTIPGLLPSPLHSHISILCAYNLVHSCLHDSTTLKLLITDGHLALCSRCRGAASVNIECIQVQCIPLVY